MGRPRQWPPRVIPHKRSGQDRVYLTLKNGRRQAIDLGPSGSEQARAAYARLLADHAAGRAAVPKAADLTVAGLVAAYHRAEGGKLAPKDADHLRRALQPLLTLYGPCAVADFGPAELDAVRASYLTNDWTGRYVNRLASRVRKVWKWGVCRKLVAPELHHGLTLLEPLRAGTPGVRWHEPVADVPAGVVEATLPWLPEVVADMVRLQQLSGLRPGEVCGLTPGAVERPGLRVDGVDVWVYRPARHKTRKTRRRLVPLGPQAQAVLAPYLLRAPDAPCFSPAESVAKFRERQRQERKSKVQPSQADRKRARPKKGPGERYTTESYGRAITRSLERAARAGEAIPHWHPHQLRHKTATLVQGELSLDEARALLGHAHADTTLIYAHADLLVAARAVARLG